MFRSLSSPAVNCRPRRTRSFTPWRAASSSRAWNRPSGCSTRRRCSCIASITDLPAEKQRMLERLNSSDEDLVGRTVLLVDDDARNIFALSSVLERRGMKVLTATTGREAIALLETTPELAIVLMDIMMPEMDGYQTIERIRANPALPPPADHRPDSQGDEGRPRKMSGGRRLGLSRKARQHRTASVGVADVAASLGAVSDPWTERQSQCPAGRRPAGEAAQPMK